MSEHLDESRLKLLYLMKDHPRTEEERKVVDWMISGAEQGNSGMEAILGRSYLYAKGVRYDPVKAVEWLAKSAAQGNAGAYRFLGLIYCHGEGIPKDEVKGLLMLEEAITLGDIGAIPIRTLWIKTMSEVDIKRVHQGLAQRLSMT